jgi:hypothetical protein
MPMGGSAGQIGFVWRAGCGAGAYLVKRISYLESPIGNPQSPIAGVSPALIGFVFSATLVSGPETVQIGFVWRGGLMVCAHPAPARGVVRPSTGGDLAGRGVGLWLFDVHSYSLIMLSIYHTPAARPVKQKPGFLTTKSAKGHEDKPILGRGLRRNNDQQSLINSGGPQKPNCRAAACCVYQGIDRLVRLVK